MKLMIDFMNRGILFAYMIALMYNKCLYGGYYGKN